MSTPMRTTVLAFIGVAVFAFLAAWVVSAFLDHALQVSIGSSR